MNDLTVLDEARAWLAEDPDPATRSELADLLGRAAEGESAAIDDIGDRFRGRLEFGTAGLRGALGAGPNRMNRVVVIRAAAGLASYLRAHGGRAVVVGFDARHNSDVFAHDTCAVMVGAGLRAMVLPRPLPTPVLAFAIRHLGADAGVMVTASHNPPQDNGYKVYLGDGSQIVPPADLEISAAIAATGPLASIPLAENGWETLDEAILGAYLARAASVARPPSAAPPSSAAPPPPAAPPPSAARPAAPRDVRIVYTPLHGVGGSVVVEALRLAGFPEPIVEPAQAEPDPDFPTVTFPNPEEPGAMDLCMALAQRVNADLVIANDPDADRCAVGTPTPAGWRMLRGDEVGALLAVHLVQREPGLTGTYACSIVSSSLLGKIAARHSLAYEETLTGFKWIGRVKGLRFGYEEALGYCVDPDAVRDKDGISAAVLVAELAADLKAAGRSITDALDDIARDYGLHATDQLSVRVTDLAEITAAMERLRTAPPTRLGQFRVLKAQDLSAGVDGLPPTDGLRYYLTDDARVIVRPSGTEPKLKCYLEVVVPVPDEATLQPGQRVGAARRIASAQLDGIKADLAAAIGVSA